jgi:hypothetical protein
MALAVRPVAGDLRLLGPLVIALGAGVADQDVIAARRLHSRRCQGERSQQHHEQPGFWLEGTPEVQRSLHIAS